MKIIVRIILLVAFVGLIVIGVWYLHGQWVWRHAWELTVLFDSGTVPRPGAPVRYRGIDVGKVEAVRVPPDGKNIQVVIRLKTKLALRTDASILVVTEGLLGERLVEIGNLGEKGPLVRSGDVVAGVPEKEINFLGSLEKLEKVVGQIEDLVALNERVAKLEKRVSRFERDRSRNNR